MPIKVVPQSSIVLAVLVEDAKEVSLAEIGVVVSRILVLPNAVTVDVDLYNRSNRRTIVP